MANRPKRYRRRSPNPEEIAVARGRVSLTQTQAAALVYVSPRAWQAWESGERRMSPAVWELWQMKAGLKNL